MSRRKPRQKAALVARRRAHVVVEFGFIAVLLGTLVAGMVELGRAVMVKSLLTDASRKGASAAASPNKSYTDIYNEVDAVLVVDHELPATLSNGKATLTVSVAAWNAASQTYGSDVQVTGCTFAPNQYDKVSVKVTVQAADVSWFFLNYANGNVESETVVMMRQ